MTQRTTEAIRALRATADLPTLGTIFGLCRLRSYQMAHGEKSEQADSLIRSGARTRVTVQPILEVLSQDGSGDGYAWRGPSGPGRTSGLGQVPDEAVLKPSCSVVWGKP